MRFLRVSLLCTAALGLLMLCCGPDGPVRDCAEAEIKHSVEGVCVKPCNAGSDCPDSAKDCGPIVGTTGGSTDAGTSTDGGTSGGQKICRCATTALCAG